MARAQSGPEEPPRLFEGALENDTRLEAREAALAPLLEGDAAWKEGARERAFDAWRAAIAASGADGAVAAPPPGPAPDADGTLARRSEDAAWTVMRRLRALDAADRAAWTVRFEPLAAGALTAAGADRARLADVERAFPLTRAASLAALRLADLAHEEGDAWAAGAWRSRARAHGDPLADDVATALARRERDAVREPPAERVPLEGARALTLAATVELPGRDVPRDFEAPTPGIGAVGDAVWIHSAGRLFALSAQAVIEHAIDVRALAPADGAPWTASFAEEGAAWTDSLVAGAGGSRLVLVVGRARDRRSNALVCLDARGEPRVAWAWGERGLAGPAARADAAAWFAAGSVVEFQHGPVLVGERLVLQMRVWEPGEDGRAAVDEARCAAWSVALDVRDGGVVWTRHLATGSTARGRLRGRMGQAETSALPGLSLVSDGRHVVVGTELGVTACADALDGRLAWCVRTARAPAAGGLGGIVLGEDAARVAWFAPRDAGGVLYRARLGPDLDGAGLWTAAPVPFGRVLTPISARGDELLFLSREAGRLVVSRESLGTGPTARSVPLAGPRAPAWCMAAQGTPRGSVLAAADGRVVLLDGAADLRVRSMLEVEPLRGHAPLDLRVGDGRVWVASPGRVVLARTE